MNERDSNIQMSYSFFFLYLHFELLYSQAILYQCSFLSSRLFKKKKRLEYAREGDTIFKMREKAFMHIRIWKYNF